MLGGKWGTPDVIGVLKPRAQDIFKFEPQIVTAEIKATPGQPVVAFGQAAAYRLFSHKSYIVVSRTTTSDDMNRLTSASTTSHDQTHLADCMAAYNFARRLETLSGLAPNEYIAKIRTSEPDRFIVNPIHQMPEINT